MNRSNRRTFLLQLERHQPYETHNIMLRPTISGPDIQYHAPKTKQRFRSCSKSFSPRSASKIHEHFDQQNGTKLFFPQLCFIPFTICQVSSKIVKQRRSTWPLRRSYCSSRWIMSNSRRSTVLCFTASKNKRFVIFSCNNYYLYSTFFHTIFKSASQ